MTGEHVASARGRTRADRLKAEFVSEPAQGLSEFVVATNEVLDGAAEYSEALGMREVVYTAQADADGPELPRQHVLCLDALSGQLAHRAGAGRAQVQHAEAARRVEAAPEPARSLAAARIESGAWFRYPVRSTRDAPTRAKCCGSNPSISGCDALGQREQQIHDTPVLALPHQVQRLLEAEVLVGARIHMRAAASHITLRARSTTAPSSSRRSSACRRGQACSARQRATLRWLVSLTSATSALSTTRLPQRSSRSAANDTIVSSLYDNERRKYIGQSSRMPHPGTLRAESRPV